MTKFELQPIEYEKTIIAIMRRLPSERLPYLVEFARFLEFQTKHPLAEPQPLEPEPSQGDTQWEALLAQTQAKSRLREMAQDAREEYTSGNTTEIGVTDDGYLKPA